jgi:cyclic beta-1,2-glucan synthetase
VEISYGYLYTLKQFLIENQTDKTTDIINSIDNIIKNTNFSVLYDEKKRIFSIGYNVEENKLTDSYYDLLASEARQASLIAIAKQDVPVKHWSSLSRTLTSLNRYKGLISWSGTAFEYLMPNINIKTYKGSLLDESCRFMLMSQKEYAKELNLPWGISEAAFNLRDFNNNYQYKAFGIPWLGLKRGLEEDMVVSPYAIFLSLKYDPVEAIYNLRQLERQDMYGEYGFYESIDYTISRLQYGKTYEPVKTYMAHHQGLILLSINNLINNEILVKRFSSNPEIEAVDILLQERMPEKAIITKEKKEKVQKLKLKDYENYSEKVYTKLNTNLNTSNVISNGKYTIVSTLKGTGYSKYKNLLINRYKETADYSQGICFYIKNLNTKQIYSNLPEGKGKVTFAQDKTEYKKIEGSIEVKTKITVAPEEPVEIRRLSLKNNGNNVETLEVTSYFEPVLSTDIQDYAHTAFNNLFLIFKEIGNGNILIKRKKRGPKQRDIYAGVSLYTESETIGDAQYEIDKEKFIGTGNLRMPEAIKNSKPFSKSLGLVTDPGLAIKKTIKIMPGETATLDLVISAGFEEEQILKLISNYSNEKTISKVFELSKAKTEAETVYLGLKASDIEKYQKMLGYLIFQNPMRKEVMAKLPKRVYSQSELWKYGISGDLPILLVKIKDVNDMHVIKDTLKAMEFFRSKNVKIDLVILNEEKNSYEHFIQFEIENEIQNKQLAFLKNTFGGIFVINAKEITKEDLELLEFRSNLKLDASLGNIDTQLKDLEEEYQDSIKNIGIENNDIYMENGEMELINEDYTNLKYYNDYGGFTEDGLEYKMKISNENKLPTAWSNILANPNFGTVVTQNLGGFTWSKNSRLNRLSAWNNSSNIDIPSEIIYMKNKETGRVWSLSQNIGHEPQEYQIWFWICYNKNSKRPNNTENGNICSIRG